jgi:hypothetical protein
MSLPSVASAFTTNVAPHVASGIGVRNDTETAPPDGGADEGESDSVAEADGDGDPLAKLGCSDGAPDEQAHIPTLSAATSGTTTRVRAAYLVIEGSTSCPQSISTVSRPRRGKRLGISGRVR